jgi:hypothetical protein
MLLVSVKKELQYDKLSCRIHYLAAIKYPLVHPFFMRATKKYCLGISDSSANI